MEKEVQIIIDLFIPVLRKDERFDTTKCDDLFWEKITNQFVHYEQDSKPFYASIYSLELADAENIINKLENLQLTFLEQLAEEKVLGYTSEVTLKLEENNTYFIEKVQFYKNLEKAITLSERKRIKSELPTMFEKYSFEIDENLLSNAITKSERQALRDKMKVWDEELLVENEKELVTTLHSKNIERKTIPLFSYFKYAVAACLIVVFGFWLYYDQKQIEIPENPVVTKPNENENNLLEKPQPTLVDAIKNTSVTDVLVDEGFSYSKTSQKINVISINNTERIASIEKAIDLYQKYIDKELLKNVSGSGPIIKSILKEMQRLESELNELKNNRESYLFDGKTLTLYDVSPNAITVLAFDDNYYVKKKNVFYTLIVTNEPQKYSKVSDSTLRENLEKILYRNGQFD